MTVTAGDLSARARRAEPRSARPVAQAGSSRSPRAEGKKLDDFALLIERRDGPPVTMNLQNIYVEAQLLDGDARAERCAGPCSRWCPSLARLRGTTRRRC
jgi:hypothetical protein